VVPIMDAGATINPELAGSICADQITPYPPGIPVLVPGQEIQLEVLVFLRSILMSQRHTEVHGLTYRNEIPHLRIAG
jgi:arginine decarboxylase